MQFIFIVIEIMERWI